MATCILGGSGTNPVKTNSIASPPLGPPAACVALIEIVEYVPFNCKLPAEVPALGLVVHSGVLGSSITTPVDLWNSVLVETKWTPFWDNSDHVPLVKVYKPEFESWLPGTPEAPPTLSTWIIGAFTEIWFVEVGPSKKANTKSPFIAPVPSALAVNLNEGLLSTLGSEYAPAHPIVSVDKLIIFLEYVNLT